MSYEHIYICTSIDKLSQLQIYSTLNRHKSTRNSEIKYVSIPILEWPIKSSLSWHKSWHWYFLWFGPNFFKYDFLTQRIVTYFLHLGTLIIHMENICVSYHMPGKY